MIKFLKFIFLLPSKKDNFVGIIKQNLTKHVYISFFNPLKVQANSKWKVRNEFRGVK